MVASAFFNIYPGEVSLLEYGPLLLSLAAVRVFGALSLPPRRIPVRVTWRRSGTQCGSSLKRNVDTYERQSVRASEAQERERETLAV